MAAHDSIRKGSRSFATASRLFDRETRERVWLLYAWCRACDDIADEQEHGRPVDHDLAEVRLAPENRLATIRTLTELAMAGESTGAPAFDALGQLLREVPITPAMVEDVLAGFALDSAEWRPHTQADMLRYCYHVAGAVGVMMATVMGVDPNDKDTLDRACHLGIAFQLGNILRDLREDDAAGRCYIPVEWLIEAGIPPRAMGQPRYRGALALAMSRVYSLSRQYEASARVGAARLTFRQRWAVLAAANIYGAIARDVERLRARAWDRRVRIGPVRKLALGAIALGESARAASDVPHRLLSREELRTSGSTRPPEQKI